jgi:hypothetical protein
MECPTMSMFPNCEYLGVECWPPGRSWQSLAGCRGRAVRNSWWWRARTARTLAPAHSDVPSSPPGPSAARPPPEMEITKNKNP